jgi:WD40 repeat protein
VVDQMTDEEAARLLTGDLTVSADLVTEARELCGAWPVLLSLVHGAVRDAVRGGGDADGELRQIVAALRTDGITALDVASPDQRSYAASRTIDVSLRRLAPDERDRYAELAVFGEDVRIPVDVVVRLWEHTGGWSGFRSRRFCRRLFDLSLLAAYDHTPPSILLHDVVRSYLQSASRDRRAELHRALVEAHRVLNDSWAALDPAEHYLWTWLPTHLHEAGCEEELDELLSDPRWLVGKLSTVGAAGLETDVLLSTDPGLQALAVVVRQNAHLLASLNPPGALAATLAARLSTNHATLALLKTRLNATVGHGLTAVGEPPDLAHPALSRVLGGHDSPVRVAAAVLAATVPSTGMLATVDDATTRLWDLAYGALRHVLRTDNESAVRAIATDPAGRWIATAGDDDIVRIWDTATGILRRRLIGHTNAIHVLIAAPNGRWLASAGDDRTIRVWNSTDGGVRHVLTGHTAWVRGLATAPDGRWLASSGYDGTLRIWDPANGALLHLLTGHADVVRTLAASGTWLASAGDDRTLRVWDAATGELRHTHHLTTRVTGRSSPHAMVHGWPSSTVRPRRSCDPTPPRPCARSPSPRARAPRSPRRRTEHGWPPHPATGRSMSRTQPPAAYATSSMDTSTASTC